MRRFVTALLAACSLLPFVASADGEAVPEGAIIVPAPAPATPLAPVPPPAASAAPAVALVPPSPGAAESRRGDYFLHLRSHARALGHYLKALELDAAFTPARLRAAFCLHNLKRTDEALVHLEKLVELAPRSAESWLPILDIQLGRKAFAQAAATLERARKAGCDSPLLDLRAAQLSRRRAEAGGDDAAAEKAKAIAALEALAKILVPTSALAQEVRRELMLARFGPVADLLLAGQEALAVGNAALALEKADAALAKDAAFVEAHFLRGQALATHALNRISDAIAAFEKAGSTAAFLATGQLHYEKGDMEEAEAALQKALAKEPAHQDGHYQLGLVYRELGEYPRAIVAWRKAVAIAPTSELGKRAATKVQVLTGEVRGLSEGEVLDPASERHLGQKFMEMSERRWGRYENEKLQARLTEIARRLVAVSDRAGEALRYEIRMVKQPGVNAVTFPGGKILFFRGMIDFIEKELGGSDEIYAAVLSHEIAHAALRHGVTKAKLISAQALLAEENFNASNGLQSFLSGFSRANEFEADQYGALYAYRAGFDPAAGLLLHRAMLAKKEIPEGLGHPPHKQRIARLRDYLLELRAKTRGFKVGLRALGKHDYTRAIAHFEVFLGVFPQSTAARNNLALAMHRKSLVKLAQRAFRKSSDIDPDAKAPPIRLRAAAMTQTYKGDAPGSPAAAQQEEPVIDRPLLREAVGELHLVLRQDGAYTPAHVNLAGALLDLGGERESALAHLRTALGAEPNNVHAQNNLAVAHLEAGENEQGLPLLRKLAERADPHPDALYNLGVALERAGDRPAAAKAFTRYLELDKDSGWAKLARARLAALQ